MVRGLRSVAVGAVLFGAGAWLVFLWMRATGGVPGYDIYQYWLPNMLYALDGVHAGGSGLLWNPFQNCGQPSFGISSTGLLYPLNLFFLVLTPQHTMYVQLICNFAIAGAGTYWLLRELDAAPAAALCGALAFELGTATVDINMWTLQVGDAWVWLPMTLLFCERLLGTPSVVNVAGLGASTALSLLSGSPQIVLFTYQLVALRVAFEYATRRPVPSLWHAAAVAAGLVLGPLIDAVQLVPGVETAANSVRATSLTLGEMRSELSVTWAYLLDSILRRTDLYNPVILIPFGLAAAAWLRASTRRYAAFYALAGLLAVVLSFGPATPLFLVYVRLPFGNVFRAPDRFIWMATLCMSVLAGLGVDAILRNGHTAERRRTYAAAICLAVALACVYALRHFNQFEWALVGILIASAVLATRGQKARRVAALFAIVATAGNVLTYGSPGLPDGLNALATRQMSIRRLLPDQTVYAKYGDVFTDLRGRMTPQDRVFFLHENWNFALAPKLASLYRLPSIDDYEPQPSRRWAEYLVMLRTGLAMTSLDQSYYPRMEQFLPGMRRPLLDLAAVRYVLVDQSVPSHVETLSHPLSALTASSDGKVKVYENRQALPRAFYVPRVEVVEPTHLLRVLASGREDPRRVALVEVPPPSGFLGADDASAPGTAEFVVDEPERVVVRVQASQPGFLHLGDQHAPGWTATVNGAPAEVLRANHVFRLVQVPGGESVVEFRYAPASVRVGAVISGVTVTILAAAIVLSWRRSRER